MPIAWTPAPPLRRRVRGRPRRRPPCAATACRAQQRVIELPVGAVVIADARPDRAMQIVQPLDRQVRHHVVLDVIVVAVREPRHECIALDRPRVAERIGARQVAAVMLGHLDQRMHGRGHEHERHDPHPHDEPRVQRDRHTGQQRDRRDHQQVIAADRARHERVVAEACARHDELRDVLRELDIVRGHRQPPRPRPRFTTGRARSGISTSACTGAATNTSGTTHTHDEPRVQRDRHTGQQRDRRDHQQVIAADRARHERVVAEACARHDELRDVLRELDIVRGHRQPPRPGRDSRRGARRTGRRSRRTPCSRACRAAGDGAGGCRSTHGTTRASACRAARRTPC